jgi:hypothetical protein
MTVELYFFKAYISQIYYCILVLHNYVACRQVTDQCYLAHAKELPPGVPDDHVTASSYFVDSLGPLVHAPYQGRLDARYEYGVTAVAWVSDFNDEYQYIQVMKYYTSR